MNVFEGYLILNANNKPCHIMTEGNIPDKRRLDVKQSQTKTGWSSKSKGELISGLSLKAFVTVHTVNMMQFMNCIILYRCLHRV